MAASVAAGPLALASSAAVGGMRSMARGNVTELEDRAALSILHQRLVLHVNGARSATQDATLFAAGARIALDEGVRRLDLAEGGDSMAIERAPGGRTATLHVRHLVRSESSLRPDCTEARMAIAQGCGTVRSADERALRIDCIKATDGWKVRSLSFDKTELDA